MYVGVNMSRRKIERDYSRRIPVSITLTKEMYEFIDDLIDRKVFKDRSHAINATLDYHRWTLQNDPMRFYGPRNPK